MKWRRLAGLLSVTLLGASCGDEGLSGPTVRIDLIVDEFTLSGPNDPGTDRTICLLEPVEHGCVRTEDSGFAEIEVPASTDVLLEVSGPDDFPTLVSFRSGESDMTVLATVYTQSIVDAISIIYEREVDPTRGQVVFAAEPRVPENAGHSFELLDEVTGEPVPADAFYLDDDGLPDPMATTTPTHAFGGLVNAPVGDFLMVIPMNDHCANLARGWPGTTPSGESALKIPIRAGRITSILWLECASP